MKIHTVFAIAAAIAGIAAPVFAQAPAQVPDQSANSLRMQVRTMETVFTTAVTGSVQQVAKQIIEAIPGIQVVSGVPRAHGYAIEGHGWFFDVEIPEMRWATIELFNDAQRQPPQMSVGNNRTPVAPALIQTPDTAQLREDYRKAIREGLMDAILDFGQVPLQPNESLTVGARSADSPVPGLDNDTVTLVLQITGEDLSLFRQTKITREEAKKRIKAKEDRR